MRKFSVLVAESARRSFEETDADTQKRLRRAFGRLEEDPFLSRSGTDIKKLRGLANPALYRIRAGDYRMIYSVEDGEVKVTFIIHRGKGYRWLE